MMLTAPLFPLFLQDLGADATEISLILASSGIVSTIFMAVSPILAQKYGTKKIMLISAIISIPPQIVFSITDRWEYAAPWTIVFNAAWALRIPAQMLFVAEHSQSGTAGRVFGFTNLVFPIANIIGPTIGGYLADVYGWNYAFYFTAAMYLICLFPLLLIKDMKATSSGTVGGNTYKSLFTTNGLRRPVMTFSLSELLHTTGIGLANLVIPLYLTSRFGLTKTAVGFYFSIGGGLAMLLAQMPSGYLTDRYGGKKTMLQSLASIPIFFILYPFATDYYTLLLVYMAISGLHSATWPASTTYIINLVQPSMRGVAIGIRQTVVRLGFTIGPFLGGMLWQYSDYYTTFYVAGAISALSILLVITLPKNE